MRTFDRSQVPPHLQNVPILDRLEAEAIAKLGDPKFRWGTCAHEAAHGRYRLQAGAVRLIYHGPRFEWNETQGGVEVVYAGMGSEWSPPRKYPGGIYVNPRDMARWSAAGWIWEKELTGSVDAEASADLDRARFKIDFHKYFPDTSDEEIQKYWDRAEAEVRADLKTESIKKEIVALAHNFETWLLEEAHEG